MAPNIRVKLKEAKNCNGIEQLRKISTKGPEPTLLFKAKTLIAIHIQHRDEPPAQMYG